MHIVKTWCESIQEGMDYLRYNGYRPILRIGKYWLVRKIGTHTHDIKIIL